ncbi:MAG: ABC transporter substrate-binding protein [Chloroflexota bacterium]
MATMGIGVSRVDGHDADGRETKRSRRAVLGGLGTGVSGVLLVACGALPGAGGQEAAKTAAPVTVTFMSRTSEEEAFTKRSAAFREQHPQITLEYRALPGSYPEVVRTNAAAGTLTDVIYLQNLVFEGLAAGGDLQPIDALIKRDRLNLGQWYDSGIKGFQLDGKQFGLPARGQIQHCYLYYNRDAFQRAGLREPDDRWTLDDLVAAADKLTVRGQEQFGYGTMWSTFGRLVAATRRFGGDALSPDGKRSLVDSPQALQALQWHWELWHRRQVMAPKSAGPADFGTGTVAMLGMMLAGQRSTVRTAVKDAFRWTMVLLPKGPTGKLGADTSIAPISLNARTKVADQGWQVVKWFTDKETGVALALQQMGSNTPGMRKDVYCDERVLADPLYPRDMMERVCKAMDLSPTVPYSVPYNFRQPEVEEVVKKHMNAFMANTATPNAATMRTFHTELQAVLDLPRAGG